MTTTQPQTKTKQVFASYEGDSDFAWDDFKADVQSLMKRLRIKKFFAYGLALTWRNVAGYTEFETVLAATLIHKLAPKTSEFTMKIQESDNKGILEVIVSHHDKPMGETMYLMAQSREVKEGIKAKYFTR